MNYIFHSVTGKRRIQIAILSIYLQWFIGFGTWPARGALYFQVNMSVRHFGLAMQLLSRVGYSCND